MSDYPLWIAVAAIAAAVVAVIAVLPDPSQPAIVPLGGVLGGFVAASIARLPRWPSQEIKDAGLDGGYWGTALALAIYLIALVAGV